MQRSVRLVLAIAVAAILVAAGTIFFRHRDLSSEATTPAPVQKTEVQPSINPQPIQPDSQVEPSQENASPEIHPLHLPLEVNEPTAFTLLATGEVTQLMNGITLDQWMDKRGTPERWEKGTDDGPAITDGADPKCADYQRYDELPSKAVIMRRVYFYPPPTPVPAVFPSQNIEELRKGCLLGEIEIEAGGVWEMDNKTFLSSMRQEFTKQYGASIDIKARRFSRTGIDIWRPYFDQGADVWIHNDAQIVAGTKGQSRAPLVRAQLAFLKELDQPVQAPHDDSLMLTQFHQAVSATAVDAALSQRMEKQYELEVKLATRLNQETEEMCRTVGCLDATKLPKPTGDDWREPLLPLLQDWFKALATLGPGQRASGLLAADRLVRAFESVRPFGHFGNVKSSTAQQRKLRAGVQALGAKFSPDYANGDNYYVGNWLDDASQLDPDSEGGRLALVTWLSDGKGCQTAGATTFREVILRGEVLLSKKVDEATAAQVHFMVGDAYSDIYAIAKGGDQSGSYTDIGTDEAEPARAKALEHYRAGLAVDNTSENAKDAWRQAWHLSAGFLPHTRYVCFGD